MVNLFEIVPNISEGRNLSIIRAVAEYVENKSSLKILDIHSDPDHNRSVFTIVGTAEPIMEAAFRLVEKTAELIDVTKHSGVHPFIGSTDVLPFIPLGNSSMDEAVEYAKEAGGRIWRELKIPVYLYGEANPDSERFNLPNIRKGGLSGLRDRIHDFTPDIGDPKLHPMAGSIAVGARKVLIAFNVNLKTDNLILTKEIARSLREKHGGLPAVRALGLALTSRGITQVSMNLIDYEKSGLLAAYNAVETLAKANGIDILESEIVGMVPKEAVSAGLTEKLKLIQPIMVLPA